MALDTFEERQAYIRKCELEMLEAHARSARQRALMDQVDAALQAYLLQYQIEITTLIYRGMFDPTFCAPQSNRKGENDG
jgi:hypothetical protein